MIRLCVRNFHYAGLLHWRSAALFATFIAFAWPAAADESIVVSIDKSTIINLPVQTKTIVLGNPLIADIRMLRTDGGNLIIAIIGVGYGATNLDAFDSMGVGLTKKIIQVTGPTDDTAAVYRGADRETYSCTPECSARLTLGDSKDFFNNTMDEIKNRSSQAAAAGAQSSGAP